MIRNGIGIDEQASVPVTGVQGVWPLRASTAAVHDTCLVQTIGSTTVVLGFDDDSEELGEVVLAGLDAARPTLWFVAALSIWSFISHHSRENVCPIRKQSYS